MTICTEEKLDVISQNEKGEWIVDTQCNVRFAHSSIHTIRDNAGTFTESAMSEPKVFVQQVYHSLIEMNHTKNYGGESLTISLH